MRNEGLQWRRAVQAIALVTLALGLSAAGCGSLKMPTMPWSKSPSAAPMHALAPPPLTAPVASASIAPPNAYGETIDSVVASVDGNPITSHDLKDPAAVQAASQSGLTAANLPETAPDGSGPVLKALIEQKLLEQESEKYADKAGDDEVDRYLQTMEEHNHVTDEQLHAQLQSQGISYPQFRQSIRKQVQAAAMLDREVRQKIVIPNSEIEAYYKTHPGEFSVTDERYRLAQILIAVPPEATPEQIAAAQKKAEDVRKQAAKGKDFAELARQYSDDDSKSKGGELGDFGPNDLNDQIAAAVKNLKGGEISAVVHTKYGFHVVKVEQHQTPGAVPLDQAKAAIRDKLTTDKAKAGFQKWIDQDLTSQHYVETMN